MPLRSYVCVLAQVFLVVLVSAAVPAATQASACVDWGNIPTPLADLDAGGQIHALVRSDDLLLAGVDGRLRVADFAAGMPAWLGEWDFGTGTVYDVAASGTLAAVARGSDGVALVDLTDPGAPQIVGAMTEAALAVGFAGDLLCTASRSGLTVYDVTDPAVPILLGFSAQAIGGDTFGRRIVGRDGACWVMSQGALGQLAAFDLTSPAAPAATTSIASVLGLSGSAKPTGIALAGNVLYLLADEWSTFGSPVVRLDTWLFALDVADAGAPTKLGEVSLGRDAAFYDLALCGTTAHVTGTAIVRSFDVSNPGGMMEISNRSALGPAGGELACAGSYVFIGDTSVRTVDTSVVGSDPVLGSVSLGGQTCLDPLAFGDHIMLPEGAAGYPGPGGFDDYSTAVLDVANPDAPVPVRSLGGPYGIGAVAVVGNYLYGEGIANWQTGDWLTFGGPLPAGRPLNLGTALYALSPAAIWDVGTPTAPEVAGDLLPSRSVTALAATGSIVYAVCTDGLEVLDAADPLAPVSLASLPLSGSYPMAETGDSRLVVANADGILVVDVSDPTVPLVVGNLAVPGIMDLAVVEGTAYLALQSGGVEAVDVGGGMPVELGVAYFSENDPAGLCVAGGEIFAAYQGLWGYQSTNTVHLYHLAPQCSDAVAAFVSFFATHWQEEVCRVEFGLPGGADGVQLVARGEGRDRVVPWETAATGGFVAEDAAWSGEPGDQLVYVIQYREGENAWLDLAETHTEVPLRPTRLARPYPNPFNPETTVSFVLARSGPIRLDVFGPDGRRVRTLAAERLEAGPHTFNWNGQDTQGRTVAAGVYLMRLETADAVRTRKVALVK